MAITPEKLLDALNAARGVINQNGEFPAATRKQILELIDALLKDEHADAGYLRRARLALICLRKVISCISSCGELKDDAIILMENAHLAIRGKYDILTLELENRGFHTRVINLLDAGEIAFASVYAAMACFAAVSIVLYDTDFESSGADERDIHPDEWDVSFYASLAVSGSAAWEGKGGGVERTSFWNWYLSTAVPLAWEVDAEI